MNTAATTMTSHRLMAGMWVPSSQRTSPVGGFRRVLPLAGRQANTPSTSPRSRSRTSRPGHAHNCRSALASYDTHNCRDALPGRPRGSRTDRRPGSRRSGAVRRSNDRCAIGLVRTSAERQYALAVGVKILARSVT
jgi:hypothetical protein